MTYNCSDMTYNRNMTDDRTGSGLEVSVSNNDVKWLKLFFLTISFYGHV